MAHIAIVGATGMVGRQMLKSLEERSIRLKQLTLYASKRSAGETLSFKGQPLVVSELTEDSIDPTIDVALFSAGAHTSLTFTPLFNALGITVIDNSSAFRQSDAPLVVPEVNKQAINVNDRIVANPNCSTIQCVIPLHVLHTLSPLKRVLYSTYQAVSGSGQKGIQALTNETTLEDAHIYPKPIVHNVIPHIDTFLDDGYTKEEQKMRLETRKILGLETLSVSATCVRVPVMHGHAVSVTVTTEHPVDLPSLTTAFKAHEALIYHDHPLYPTPLEVAGEDMIHIGRLRRDLDDPKTLHFWCVADNIRKGAATNAIQILEHILEVPL